MTRTPRPTVDPELVTRWLPAELAGVIRQLPASLWSEIQEIRIRAGRPLQVVAGNGDWFVAADGQPVSDPEQAFIPDLSLVNRTWQVVCQASVYSRDYETSRGYLTLPAGQRVGVSGRIIAEDDRVIRFRDVAGLNFRIPRELPGCADSLLTHIVDRRAKVPYNTLILSPPGAGKTTLLRDVIRQLSTGVPRLGLPGLRVALIDERGELAACDRGVPTLDVGPRTDVLDGCPKAVGTLMAIRTLNPQVVAFDELGSREDAQAVLEAAYAGVRVITTGHAHHPGDLLRRPSWKDVPVNLLFQRIVILDRNPQPGIIRYAGPYPQGDSLVTGRGNTNGNATQPRASHSQWRPGSGIPVGWESR